MRRNQCEGRPAQDGDGGQTAAGVSAVVAVGICVCSNERGRFGGCQEERMWRNVEDEGEGAAGGPKRLRSRAFQLSRARTVRCCCGVWHYGRISHGWRGDSNACAAGDNHGSSRRCLLCGVAVVVVLRRRCSKMVSRWLARIILHF